MEFLVQVLHFANISDSQREELKANECTYLRRLNLWLFEGDWDLCFEDLKGITRVGEVVIESIPNYTQQKLVKEVAAQLSIDPKLSWTPKE